MARHIYIRSPVGVSTMTKIYGGNNLNYVCLLTILILGVLNLYLAPYLEHLNPLEYLTCATLPLPSFTPPSKLICRRCK